MYCTCIDKKIYLFRNGNIIFKLTRASRRWPSLHNSFPRSIDGFTSPLFNFLGATVHVIDENVTIIFLHKIWSRRSFQILGWPHPNQEVPPACTFHFRQCQYSHYMYNQRYNLDFINSTLRLHFYNCEVNAFHCHILCSVRRSKICQWREQPFIFIWKCTQPP